MVQKLINKVCKAAEVSISNRCHSKWLQRRTIEVLGIICSKMMCVSMMLILCLTQLKVFGQLLVHSLKMCGTLVNGFHFGD